jgi:hypothetical protein
MARQYIPISEYVKRYFHVRSSECAPGFSKNFCVCRVIIVGRLHLGRMLSSILLVIAVAITLAVPILLLWGWLRVSQNEVPSTRSSTFSLLGFSLATASAGLAIGTHLYARFVRDMPLQDPTLVKIYAIGCLLSIVAIAFAFAGTGRPNPVRWLAPVCSIATLVFWLLAIGTE